MTYSVCYEDRGAVPKSKTFSARETLRLNAAYTASKTPPLEPQRYPYQPYLLNINILIPLIWITPLGLIDPLVLFFYKGGMLNNP